MEQENLHEVGKGGSQIATLRRLRDDLTAQLVGCDSKRDYAALSARLLDVLERIDVLEKAEPAAKGTPLDEIAQRRASKAAPKSKARATKR